MASQLFASLKSPAAAFLSDKQSFLASGQTGKFGKRYVPSSSLIWIGSEFLTLMKEKMRLVKPDSFGLSLSVVDGWIFCPEDGG